MSDLIPIVMDVIDIAIALIPPIVDITLAIIRLVSNILQGAAPAFTVMKDVILAIIEPIKVVIGWLIDLLDLIGDFLGKSRDLNKAAGASVTTVSTPRTSSRSSSRTSTSTQRTTPTMLTTIDLRTSSVNTLPTIFLNDFLISNGKLLKPHAQDTIIGTKNPDKLGGTGMTIIIEGDVSGVDVEQMAEAFGRELKRAIRI